MVEIALVDPQRMAANTGTCTPDIAEGVTDRLALARFNEAVMTVGASGDLSASVWAAFRDHGLRRALDSSGPTSTGVQRKLDVVRCARLVPERVTVRPRLANRPK